MRTKLALAAAALIGLSAPAFAQAAGGAAGTGMEKSSPATGAAGMNKNGMNKGKMHEGRAAAPNAKGPGGSAAPGGGATDATRNNGQ